MAFPGFQSGRPGVLFFSRGRGRGHAVPDLEIAREWEAVRPELDVRFVSYGTGAETIEAAGRALIKVDLPEQGSIAEMTVYAGQLIGMLEPDLVVAHEEFAALPAAKIFQKSTALITDWFASPDMHSMHCLRFADCIIFTGEPGTHEEPPHAKGRVRYTGPVMRKFEYSRSDRGRARLELGVPEQAFLIAVLPGSWTEEMLPACDLVAAAYRELPEPKRLTWIAGSDVSRIPRLDGWQAAGFEPRMDRLMCAADVAITKCNRKTLLELDWLGVPSVSLWNDANPIDFERAHTFPLNRVLDRDTSAGALARILVEQAARPASPEPRVSGGAAAAAILLDQMLDRP